MLVDELGRHPPVTRPSEVPELRNWLVDQWRPGKFWHRHAWLLTAAQKPEESNFAEHQLTGLSRAVLWWVDDDMVDLMNAMTSQIPNDTRISDLVRPATSGLVVLARPIHGIDADPNRPGMQVTIDAFLWDSVDLPILQGNKQVNLEPGVSISVYRHVSEDEPELSQLAGTWQPLGRSDWPLADALTDQNPRGSKFPDQTWASIHEDRRFLAALWSLAATPSMTDRTPLTAPRAVRRQAERAGVQASSEVTIINLRRRLAKSATEDQEPATNASGRREADHRWIVSGHPRLQACGPRWSERKLIWIAEHPAGPEGKPLKLRDKVFTIRND